MYRPANLHLNRNQNMAAYIKLPLPIEFVMRWAWPLWLSVCSVATQTAIASWLRAEQICVSSLEDISLIRIGHVTQHSSNLKAVLLSYNLSLNGAHVPRFDWSPGRIASEEAASSSNSARRAAWSDRAARPRSPVRMTCALPST